MFNALLPLGLLLTIGKHGLCAQDGCSLVIDWIMSDHRHNKLSVCLILPWKMSASPPLLGSLCTTERSESSFAWSILSRPAWFQRGQWVRRWTQSMMFWELNALTCVKCLKSCVCSSGLVFSFNVMFYVPSVLLLRVVILFILLAV